MNVAPRHMAMCKKLGAPTGAVNEFDGIVCQTLTTTLAALRLSHLSAKSLPDWLAVGSALNPYHAH